MDSFFFFGCWNREECSGFDYRRAVLENIKEQAKRNKFTFGIVAGDNIYPDTKKNANKKYKQKTYRKSVLENGFKLLNDISVQNIYVGYGNHDVANRKIGNVVAKTQADIVGQYDKMTLCTEQVCTLRESSVARYFFVDTNDGFEPLLSEVRNLLNKNRSSDKWNIIVGHEPPISFKKKYNTDAGAKFIEMLSLFDKTIYLCADTHNFQALVARSGTKQVPVIISGTAGAEPDELPPPEMTSLSHNSAITIESVAQADPYGYSRIVVYRDNVFVEYMQVISPEPICAHRIVMIDRDRTMRSHPRDETCNTETTAIIDCSNRPKGEDDALAIIYK